MNKNMPQKAEIASEHYAHLCLSCVLTRRAIRTKFQRVDFFNCDTVGKRADGSHVYLQVTTGGYEAVRQRKRKLEKIPWHASDIVQILQMTEEQEGKKKSYSFKVHEYIYYYSLERRWFTGKTTIAILPEWFKKYQEG